MFIENERKGDYLNMKKEPTKIKRVSISPADVKFVCDKERGYVRAYVYDTEDFFIDFCITNFPKLMYALYNTKEVKKLKMNRRFEGLARLSPDDKWDENLGKLIAFHRLKTKLNKSFFKKAQFFIDYIEGKTDKAVNVLNSYGERLSINSAHREKIIEEKLNASETIEN